MEQQSSNVELEIARRWCLALDNGWEVIGGSGSGKTSSVFLVKSPDGDRALKIFNEKFSTGELGTQSKARLDEQVSLGIHECPYVIKTYGGGRFEDRLFLLMERASGSELEKTLTKIPRNKIRGLVDQLARGCIFLREKGLCHRDIKSANIFVSEDFQHLMLLDLSVSRSINDPVGHGTDHGGQLPVVATSRYCSPEYLFRLIEPGPDLWHALDVYQIGGVLHDLIMREPLFDKDYLLSRENRYRFAWVVATVEPIVTAKDVDSDLVLLARRALDKDWRRRSHLRLEDFLADAGVRRQRGLEALGLAARKPSAARPGSAAAHQRVTDVSRQVEDLMVESLRQLGVTATHEVLSGQIDTSKAVLIRWEASKYGGDAALGSTSLRLQITFKSASAKAMFETTAALSTLIEDRNAEAVVELPEVADDQHAAENVAAQASAALAELAAQLMQTSETKA